MVAASIHQRDIPTLVWYECVNVYVYLLVFAGCGRVCEFTGVSIILVPTGNLGFISYKGFYALYVRSLRIGLNYFPRVNASSVR